MSTSEEGVYFDRRGGLFEMYESWDGVCVPLCPTEGSEEAVEQVCPLLSVSSSSFLVAALTLFLL
jgi:hypothetical protein